MELKLAMIIILTQLMDVRIYVLCKLDMNVLLIMIVYPFVKVHVEMEYSLMELKNVMIIILIMKMDVPVHAPLKLDTVVY